MKAAGRIIRVIQDSREQNPWEFPSSFTFGRELWTVEVERAGLQEADYALADFPGRVAIERKADLGELIGNLTGGRERFWRELDRLASYETVLLIVETGSFLDAQVGEYRSEMNRASLLASIHAIEEKRIPVLFPGSREKAAAHALSVFRRFLVRQERAAKAALDAGGAGG